MAAPQYTKLGARLSARTAPLAPHDEDYDYAHGHLAEGMMRPYQQVAELVDPDDPYAPWVPLFYVDICPDWALPWLAQIVGVRLPASLSADDARTVIKELAQLQRGGPEAIKVVVGLFLTGSKTVFFRERDAGDAYRLEVVTLENETPDPAAVQQAILLQKPAGIVLNYNLTTSWDHEALAGYYYLHSELPGLYPTHRDLKRGPVS
jgi:hypothetical protein